MNVIIDGIYYPVDINILNLKELKRLSECIVIPYNNGELSIGVNRENLHYNDYTINKIKSDYNNIVKEILCYYEININKELSLYQAIFKYKEYKENSLLEILFNKETIYYLNPVNNKKYDLNKQFSLCLHPVNLYRIFYDYRKQQAKEEISFNSKKILLNLNDIYIIDNIENNKLSAPINRTILNNNKEFIIFVEKKEKEFINVIYNKEEINEELNLLKEQLIELGIKVKNYINVIPTKIIPNKKNRIIVDKKDKTIIIREFINNKIVKRELLLDKNEIKFNNIFDNKIILTYNVEKDFSVNNDEFNNLEKYNNILSNFNKNYKIILTSKNKEKYLSNFDSIEEFLLKNINELENIFLYINNKSTIDEVINYPNNLLIHFDQSIKDLFLEISNLKKYNGFSDIYFLEAFFNKNSCKFTQDVYKKFYYYEKIKEKYPSISTFYNNEQKLKYIELVNEKNKYKELYENLINKI